jgi:hypothetical protein
MELVSIYPPSIPRIGVLVAIGSLWSIMGLLQVCNQPGSVLFHLGIMFVSQHPMLPCMHSKCLRCIHLIFSESKVCAP